MKNLFVPVLFLILAACGKPSDKSHHHGDQDSENPNKALYNQVMDIHDEVMPKMNDIIKLQQALKNKIASTPGMVADQKKELENMILTLDSTSRAMMNWMNDFSPLPDSADQEKARAYLESEMERIKKVREVTNENLEKANSLANKK